MKFRQSLKILSWFVLSFLIGCTVSPTGNWRNNSIDSQLRSELDHLNKKIVQSFVSNNVSEIRSLMSHDLLEKSEDLEKIIGYFNSQVSIYSYQVLDEYHSYQVLSDKTQTIFSGPNADDYTLRYNINSRESYVSLLLFRGEIGQFLMTNIFSKKNGKWELAILNIGQYSANDKNAPQLVSKAKRDYENGYLIDALNTMILANQCAKPSAQNFEYRSYYEMSSFFKTISLEAREKYSFPISVKESGLDISIFKLYPRPTDEGHFPMIEYVSNIELGNEVELRRENDQLHSIIGTVFPGINENKKYVFYRVTDEIPDRDAKYEFFGIVQEADK